MPAPGSRACYAPVAGFRVANSVFRLPPPWAESETTRWRRQTEIRNPKSEIQSAPKGEVVLDPTVSVDATQEDRRQSYGPGLFLIFACEVCILIGVAFCHRVGKWSYPRNKNEK